MNIEELLKLSGAALKAIADEKGINYPARITNPKLAELIHAENAKTENANVSQTVETQTETGDVIVLGNGIFSVPGQMIMVRERQEGGDLIEKEMSLDEVLSIGHIELSQKVTELEQENRDLKALNIFHKDAAEMKDTVINELQAENTDLKEVNARLEASAMREVIGHPSQTPLAVHATEDGTYATIRPTWNSKESMKVRVRVAPNKGISSRIRAGMQFGVQYSEHEIDEATFKALIADSHLQVDALDE